MRSVELALWTERWVGVSALDLSSLSEVQRTVAMLSRFCCGLTPLDNVPESTSSTELPAGMSKETPAFVRRTPPTISKSAKVGAGVAPKPAVVTGLLSATDA